MKPFSIQASILLLVGATGCASTATPSLVTQAHATLSSRDTGSLRMSRPQLVAEAEARMEKADRAIDAGDEEEGILYAEQALQFLQMAQDFVARDRADAMADLLEKEHGVSLAAQAVEKDAEEAAKVVANSDGSPLALRAERAIERATVERIQTTATPEGVKSPAFDTGTSMLKSAVKLFDEKAYRASAEAADGAALAFAEARVKREPEKLPVGKPGEVAVAAVPGSQEPPKEKDKAPASEAPVVVALPPAPPNSEGVLRKQPSIEALAKEALRRFDLQRIEAIERGDDQSCSSFRAAEAFRGLAKERLDEGEFAASFEFSTRADERLKRCLPQKSGRDERKPLTDSEPTPGARPGSKEPPKEVAAPKDETKKIASDREAKLRAMVAIENAEAARERATAVAPSHEGTITGRSLQKSAARFFEEGEYVESQKFAERAIEAFNKVKPEVTKPEAKTPSDKPAADKKSELAQRTEWPKDPIVRNVTKVAPPPKPAVPTEQVAWQTAIEAIERANSKGDAAARLPLNESERSALFRGDEELGRGRVALSHKAYADAVKSAESAEVTYDALLRSGRRIDPGIEVKSTKDAPAGTPPAGSAKPPVAAPPASPPAEKKTEAKPRALLEPLPPPVVPERLIEARAREVEAVAPVDPAWKESYRAVFVALHARDEAKRVSPQKTAELIEIDRKLAESKAHWATGDLATAASLARQAEIMATPLQTPAKDEAKPAAEIDKSREKAEEKLRRAGVLQAVCEEEDCKGRDLLSTITAREALLGARRNEAEERYDAALVLATEAEEAFQKALDTKKEAPPAPQGETPEEILAKKKREDDARAAAESAMSEANVKRRICEEKNCKSREGEIWFRSLEGMTSAQVAFADGRFDVAKERADKANAGFADLLARTPTFEMPEAAKGVTREGNRLVVSPVIQFKKGSAQLDPQSNGSVDALASAIKANQKALKKISLVGFTDSLGAPTLNKKLSADRAAALREALIARGIASSLIVSEGRGAESPVADNATPAGREKNRRVEVVLDLEQGVE